MSALPGVSIETFRGDVEALEAMARISWTEEYGLASYPNLYRPAFVRLLMDAAGDPRHFIAAYKGDEILAFLANLPRQMWFQGKVHRAILSCLLVSRKEYARRGLAQALIKEALRVNQEIAGYDFALLYLETGHRSSRLIEKLKNEGQPIQFLKRMHVLGRVLDLEKAAFSEGLKNWEKLAIKAWGAHRKPPDDLSPELEAAGFEPADAPAALAMLNGYAGKSDLARVWRDEEELLKELACPGVSETIVFRKAGRPAGLMNYFIHDHVGRTTERWAWLNHVHYDALAPAERVRAVNLALARLAEKGVIGMIEWNKGYYPQGPLYRARFFPYFRSVNLYAWALKDGVSFPELRRIYEVQI